MAAYATDTSKSAVLKVDADESYTIVIPAELNISFGATETALDVEVTALRTYSTGTIANSVRALHVKADCDQKLENQNGDAITYTIKSDESQSNMLYFTQTGAKRYTVGITEDAWNAAASGSYSDTVSFEIWIANY